MTDKMFLPVEAYKIVTKNIYFVLLNLCIIHLSEGDKQNFKDTEIGIFYCSLEKIIADNGIPGLGSLLLLFQKDLLGN